jgi:hypothetical protein
MLLALTALFAAASLYSQDKTDYSGSWLLNNSKSEFGMMPPPEKMARKIEHKDPALKVMNEQTTQRGEMKSEQNYTTDGKECINKQGNAEVKSVLSWEGKNLVLKSKRDFQGTEISTTEKWILSADGKTLTFDTLISAPQGEFNIKFVMDKQ